MKNLIHITILKNSYQTVMHKKQQIAHLTKDSRYNKKQNINGVKSTPTRKHRLSTQMGIRKATTEMFKSHIHISTASSITTSYLNIYLIDLTKTPIGINKIVRNKVNYI
jgi:hypothetical protein